MAREYEKHRTAVNLMSVFEHKVFTMDTTFYQQFGVNSVQHHNDADVREDEVKGKISQ